MNPGSQEALAAGCRCPVIDNGRGRGYGGGSVRDKNGDVVFVVASDCPIHGLGESADAKR